MHHAIVSFESLAIGDRFLWNDERGRCWTCVKREDHAAVMTLHDVRDRGDMIGFENVAHPFTGGEHVERIK